MRVTAVAGKTLRKAEAETLKLIRTGGFLAYSPRFARRLSALGVAPNVMAAIAIPWLIYRQGMAGGAVVITYEDVEIGTAMSRSQWRRVKDAIVATGLAQVTRWGAAGLKVEVNLEAVASCADPTSYLCESDELVMRNGISRPGKAEEPPAFVPPNRSLLDQIRSPPTPKGGEQPPSSLWGGTDIPPDDRVHLETWVRELDARVEDGRLARPRRGRGSSGAGFFGTEGVTGVSEIIIGEYRRDPDRVPGLLGRYWEWFDAMTSHYKSPPRVISAAKMVAEYLTTKGIGTAVSGLLASFRTKGLNR